VAASLWFGAVMKHKTKLNYETPPIMHSLFCSRKPITVSLPMTILNSDEITLLLGFFFSPSARSKLKTARFIFELDCFEDL
jgi:hypothetical protein